MLLSSVTPCLPSHTLFPLNNNNYLNHHNRLLDYLTQCTSFSHLKQIHAQTLRTTPHSPPLFPFSRILLPSTSYDLHYAFDSSTKFTTPIPSSEHLIRACAHSNAFKQQAILTYLDMLNDDVYVDNSLIHFYGTCGCLDSARDVFDKMPERSVVSWNVMIDALVQLGEFENALKLFVEMQSSFEPDGYSLQSVVNACAGLGALSLGMWVHAYVLRKCDSDLSDDVLMNSSLVHMYCKCGSLDIATDLVSNMPIKPDVVIWRSLLDACCKKNAGVQLSEEVAKQLIESEGVFVVAYVLLSRVYGSASKWNEVGLVRKLMTDKVVTKEPGCSSIEIDGVAYEFFAGDTSHPQTKEIYQFLDEIEEKIESTGCYIPYFSQATLVDELDRGKRIAEAAQ
ncbi:Pentatricopeptide repeat-containing protein [Camellia lanceoleosa]|uniref:Pentatricopeptide repeat-containing protein n=1 Tax=Camellia lanceoleosa TaxID=1840588 RepID=A0ACC0G0G4_9ERIC|nr:Pentatricopeptide repeat-containing protein [Camellia lanceoleosa]